MLESMIAITIATVGIMGLLTLLSQALSLNRVITDQYAGSYLAAEGIEIVKNLIDNNAKKDPPIWNVGFAEYVQKCFEIDYVTFDIDEAGVVACPTEETSFEAFSPRTLKFNSLDGIYSYTGDTETRFKRVVRITPIEGGNEIKVNSIAKWTTRGGGEFSLNVEDHFFNWYP